MEHPEGSTTPAVTPSERIIDRPELPAAGITNENEAICETLDRQVQLKIGRSGKFEVWCDEPARIGGTDQHPSPMTYLAMAIGF